MLSRLPGWEKAFRAVIEKYDAAPYSWGETDCMCFAHDCVEAVTGRKVLDMFAGLYTSRLTAAARLKARGYRTPAEAAADALGKAGASRIDPRAARVGDVGLCLDGSIAVRLPVGFVSRSEFGGCCIVTVIDAFKVG